MIICVDFDGTIVTHDYPNIGKPVPDALRVLQELRRADHKIILFTMRSGKNLKEAEMYLQNNGVQLYGVNRNSTQRSWTQSPKAYGHLYIDDAALGIPLIEDEEFSERPFVNWSEVRKLLKRKGNII